MSERRILIAGNWKMNGLLKSGAALALGLADKMRNENVSCDILVCPPAILIPEVIHAVKDSGVAVGGQDCHMQTSGAHTGDTSAEMLKDAKCTHVIVGHSERRTDHKESSETVCAKASAAHEAGLVSIICIGESKEEYEKGATLDIVSKQLKGSLPKDTNAKNTVIAYEPIWAIGTGLTATPKDVANVHASIRKELAEIIGDEASKLKILYGGSVKPSNSAELMALEDVDGALVGGASLKVEDFWAIAKSCL